MLCERSGDALGYSETLRDALGSSGTLWRHPGDAVGTFWSTQKHVKYLVFSCRCMKTIVKYGVFSAEVLWARSGGALGTLHCGTTKTTYFTWSGASRAAKTPCFTRFFKKHRILRALERSEALKHRILRCFPNADKDAAKRKTT